MTITEVDLNKTKSDIQGLAQEATTLLSRVEALDAESFDPIKDAYFRNRLDFQQAGISDLIQKLDDCEKVKAASTKIREFNEILRDILDDPVRSKILRLLLNILQEAMDITVNETLQKWFRDSLKEAKEEALNELEVQVDSVVPFSKKEGLDNKVFPKVKKSMSLSLEKLHEKKESGENLLSWVQHGGEALEGADKLSQTMGEVRKSTFNDIPTPRKELIQAFISSMEGSIDSYDVTKSDLRDCGREWSQLIDSLRGEWDKFGAVSNLAVERYEQVSSKAQSLALNEITNLGTSIPSEIGNLAQQVAISLANISALEPIVMAVSQAQKEAEPLATTTFDELAQILRGLNDIAKVTSQLESTSALEPYLCALKKLKQDFGCWTASTKSFAENWKERLKKWVSKICPKFDGALCEQLGSNYSRLLSLLDSPAERIGQLGQNYIEGQELISKIKEEIIQEKKLSKEALQIYEALMGEGELSLDDLERKVGKLDEGHTLALNQLSELNLVQVVTSLA